ncbi:MAG: ureidoglycolate lyase [Rhodobacteraceae bacterium]|nr:ureidoglycolate lyase [Paracoccaceae bacterium]
MNDPVAITAEPLTAEAFAPFGDVLEAAGEADMVINAGKCQRFHDRARLDFGKAGRAGLSLFKAEPRTLPYQLDMLERHPHGSQAFLPMQARSFLVIVAPDEGTIPGTPRAFLTRPGQGVNYHRGIWHGVLAPLSDPAIFAVLDRIGDTRNLEEHWLETQYVVHNATL